MKYYLFALIALIGIALSFPTLAMADSTWLINRFHANLAIQEDGVLDVTETITVTFNQNKHGIYRTLPVRYSDKDGGYIYTKINVDSIQKDSINEPYTQSSDSNNLTLKIGDSRIGDLTGQHVYTLHYQVEGVLRSFAKYDEVYWNVTGSEWPVPISQATATVSLPKTGVIQQACYQGQSGSTAPCTAVPLADQEVRFSAINALSANQGMTVAVGYTKGMVPIITISPPTPVDIFQQYRSGIIAWAVTAVAGCAAVVGLWYKRGRDWWWQTPSTLNPDQAAAPKPLLSSTPVVVEFTPPLQLTPGLIGLLKDEKADTLDITSTIIDLASRGYLTITELDKTWLLGSKDYQLHKTDKDQADLLAYEKLLLAKLFKTGQQVKLSSLKEKFYKDLDKVKDALYQEGQNRHFFVDNPKTTRTRYAAIGGAVIFIAVIVGVVAASASLGQILVGLSWGLYPAGLLLIIMASSMPRKTAMGQDIWRRIQGYKLFISTAETHRQQFFEDKNLFTQVLPYAMVFGLTKKFAKAMDQIGYQPDQPTWYSGTTAFNAAIFASNLDKVSQAMTSTIASSPSSSGSGGGGSSGGGFGGGGGGSW